MTQAFKISNYYIWAFTYEQALQHYSNIIKAKGND